MVFAGVTAGVGDDGSPSAWHAEGDLLACPACPACCPARRACPALELGISFKLRDRWGAQRSRSSGLIIGAFASRNSNALYWRPAVANSGNLTCFLGVCWFSGPNGWMPDATNRGTRYRPKLQQQHPAPTTNGPRNRSIWKSRSAGEGQRGSA
jgi:hypothetical protein